jgi:hypothetical protein
MDGQGDKDATDPGLEGWYIHLFMKVDGGWDLVATTTTCFEGFYAFSGLTPGVEYAVCEGLEAGWTQTYPSAAGHLDCTFGDGYGPVGYAFELRSGEVEEGNDFGNFENVDVTVCKEKDADGDICTTDDRTPKGGWPVYLTVNGERVDTQLTDEITGCYTWADLPPLQRGGTFTEFGNDLELPADEASYYDAGEDPQEGWIALGPTYVEFEAPPQSGAHYEAVFVNTPTQGCTPGFWQGGTAGGQAGGRWLWDENDSELGYDPEWVASGGAGWNPYVHDTGFCGFFGCAEPHDMWYFVNPDEWDFNDDFHKAARSLTAGYLNASWGMAYAYDITELMDMWATAVANPFDPDVGFLALHTLLDGANNAIGGCPISASGW